MRRWGRQAILDAIANWYEREGTLPTFKEWELATKEHPAAQTAERYGGWDRVRADPLGIKVEDVPEYRLAADQRCGSRTACRSKR